MIMEYEYKRRTVWRYRQLKGGRKKERALGWKKKIEIYVYI
jgi:hypothetical protein